MAPPPWARRLITGSLLERKTLNLGSLTEPARHRHSAASLPPLCEQPKLATKMTTQNRPKAKPEATPHPPFGLLYAHLSKHPDLTRRKFSSLPINHFPCACPAVSGWQLLPITQAGQKTPMKSLPRCLWTSPAARRFCANQPCGARPPEPKPPPPLLPILRHLAAALRLALEGRLFGGCNFHLLRVLVQTRQHRHIVCTHGTRR